MNLCLSSTSDVISFDHNWHHLCPTAVGGKYLSNNTQIRVIGLMAPEICTKKSQKLSEKLHGYSMVTIARLDDAFLHVEVS